MLTVKFINIPIDKEVEDLYYFIFNCGDWNKYVFKKHPQLKDSMFHKSKKDRMNFIKKYAIDYWSKNKDAIEKSRKGYEKNWKKIERRFFSDLSEILSTKLLEKKITARMSINPICPRYIAEWSFNIFYKFNEKKANEIVMHESCHFLYFKKWKEMFPDAKEKTFDFPHIIWLLSELAAPIILNDQKIQKYLKLKAGFYEDHEKVKIGGKNAPNFFTEIYKKSPNFEDFIRVAYPEIKRHKALFKK